MDQKKEAEMPDIVSVFLKNAKLMYPDPGRDDHINP